MPYFFYYSLFGSDVTTQAFNDLLNPVFGQQQSNVRLLCTPDVLKQFLASQLPLEVCFQSLFNLIIRKTGIKVGN